MEETFRSKRPRIEDVPSEKEILRLISKRESCRQARRFAESDAIREELRSMGVEIFDREKEWKSKDGRRGKLSSAAPVECHLHDGDIQDLIFEREDARRAKDYSRADSIRDELRGNGVELDDREGVWRTSDGRRGSYSEPAPMSTSTSNVREIRSLVSERERYRAAQDFEAADDVRRQLTAMGVEIFDSERIWRSSDGKQGVIITGGHDVDCHLSDGAIRSMIASREDARARKDFAEADDIRRELRQNGVELIDSQRSWVSTDGRSGNYSGARATQQESSMRRPTYPEPTRETFAPRRSPVRAAVPREASVPGSLSEASIIALVSGRELARSRHDWKAADAIRSDLRSHGIEVWDNSKVWKASDGRSGTIAPP